MIWIEAASWALAGVLSLPLLVLAVECLVAALPGRSPRAIPDAATRPRIAVLIPAHDEAAVIARTLETLVPQLRPADRVVVVADNCSDDTATIARSHGAMVVERSDLVKRGKGYALAFGRDALLADPPEVVVVVDADCLLAEGTLDRLAAMAIERGRPAQAAYRMVAPDGAGPDRRVAAFAFLVKNVVRPLGLRRLGQPCLLTGTGMAFPWAIFRDAPLAHGHIVEDMGLAVDLAIAGQPPVFVPEAEVWAEFPVDDKAAGSQRRRWEHGHLKVIMAGVPRLLTAALSRVRPSLAILALEIGVPPLSALGMVTVVALMVLVGGVFVTGSSGPIVLLGIAAVIATFAVFVVWWRCGRGVLPAAMLARIPMYALRKIGLYLSFVVRPQKEWVRTARDTNAAPSP